MAGAEGDGLPEAASGALVAARGQRQGASGEWHSDQDSRLSALLQVAQKSYLKRELN